MTKEAIAVQAVVFDISGTVMDYGSRGPVAAFIELFARHGVAITEAEARGPMGKHKLDHVWALLSEPSIAGRWEAATGQMPTRATLEEIYAGFGAIQREVLRRHLDLIPGVAGVAAWLRQRGIRIASTTGFEQSMMDDVKAAAREQGYEPEVWVTPDLVGGGRPAPWMMYYAARQLGVYPLSTFVKVGDTAADIGEARNAGTWAVGVVASGNETGLSRAEWDGLAEAERAERFERVGRRFRELGAHAVIGTVAELPAVIEDIGRRLEAGEKP